MRYLVISDIHANLEALAAVLKVTEGEYDSIVCLGDIVGYGADPNAVTNWVRDHCAAVIRGNHDKACCGLEEPILFNPMARRAVEWTFDQLTEENRQYLRELPQGPLDLERFMMVHGAVTDEDEYLLDMQDAVRQFDHMMGRLVFFGHTHVQGGFFLRSVSGTSPTHAPHPPSAIEVRPGDSLLVNPGSIGQPRDHVCEAAYAIFDADKAEVEYRRQAYDIERAQAKIRDAGLPLQLAERLTVGR